MAGSEAEVKECWYSILGVERTASPEVIRSAYRKEALKWHPDKIQQSGASPKECQQATVRFQNIVQAYEVLSDPVERAWYDKHRSEILSTGSASKDFEFSVFSFFSPSAFSGFGNSGKGFYKVYKDAFVNIHKKEQAFAKAYGIGPIGEAPQIGNPSTPYSEVEEFYKYWTGFTTIKDFSWCDEYQVSQAPNRKVRRLMEEENSKIRKRERREYNEAVRELATFVKKRDKRWLERQVELQRLQKEKDEQWKLRRQKLQQEKLAKAMAFKEQEWAKLSNVDDADDVIEDINEGSYNWKSGNKTKTDEEDLQEFYCIVCSKRFRSEKQWKNHEKSKKHIERASALKQSFLDEDEQADTLVRNLGFEDDQIELAREQTGSATPSDGVVQVEAETGDVANASWRQNVDISLLGFRRKGCDWPQNEAATCQPATSIEQHMDIHGYLKSDDQDDEAASEDHEDSIPGEMVNAHESEQAVASTISELSLDLDAQESVVKSEKQGSSSESIEGDHGSTDDDDDDEESMLASMLSCQRNQSRFSFDRQISAEKPEREEESVSKGDLTDVGSGEETVSSSNLRVSKSKRRSKAEKKHMAASERHDGLVRELSSTQETSEVVQNGVCDGDGDDLQTETSLHVEDTENMQSTLKKKKKLQRGQKKGKLEVLGKQQVLDVNQVPAAVPQQREHMGKKGNTKGKKDKGSARPAPNTCDTCGEDFDSRSQLFRHISATNHGTIKSR